MESSDFTACHSYDKRQFEQVLTEHPNMVSRLLERARMQPQEIYITAVALNGVEAELTYGSLEVASRRMRAWLKSELDLQAGDVVALSPCNDIPSVVAIFGLLRAGCSIFFLNPAEPQKRMEELLLGMQVKHVLCATPHVATRLPTVRLLPDLTEQLGSLPDDFNEPPVRSSDAAFFFGTSGSTAASKIVAQAHYNAAINAEALCRHHRLGRGERLLGCLPIHHVNGLHFTIFATLWSGARAILMESFNPGLYQECLRKYRPTLASVVPSLLEVLLVSGHPLMFPPEFRYFVSAAAPLPVNTCKAVFERFTVRVNQGYGLTETTNFSTTMPTELSDALYRQLMVDAEIPSIGIALYGNEVAVLRADGSRAEHGEVGEICMRGHNVMLGYANNEASTREAFREGWFHSQDLGYTVRDEESGHVFFVITGRQKNMAKVMGIAVSLEEMERALRRMPQIADAACFTVPDQFLGEAVVAAVVSERPVDALQLHAHLGDYFAQVVLPTKYIRADAIPRTATGKILRAQLPKVFS